MIPNYDNVLWAEKPSITLPRFRWWHHIFPYYYKEKLRPVIAKYQEELDHWAAVQLANELNITLAEAKKLRQDYLQG